jgi:hypothetical protein
MVLCQAMKYKTPDAVKGDNSYLYYKDNGKYKLADVDLAAPVDPNPTAEETAAAKLKLARFICAAVLTDDREENQL